MKLTDNVPQVGPGPQRVPHEPPPHARTTYALVFAAGGTAGASAVSLADRATEYPLGATLVQAGLEEASGALAVMASVNDAVLKADARAACAAGGRELDLVVAKVSAWNAHRLDEPALRGAKRLYSFVRVEALLPVPPTLAQRLPLFGSRALTGAVVLRPRRPSSGHGSADGGNGGEPAAPAVVMHFPEDPQPAASPQRPPRARASSGRAGDVVPGNTAATAAAPGYAVMQPLRAALPSSW
ncbi:hypothetical protein FOA52_000455 [Chlamydomonas sp. UWO 241]|nr:hypothetical protein FOA52_000455 [Chlamydomonas sp. UWO 241]